MHIDGRTRNCRKASPLLMALTLLGAGCGHNSAPNNAEVQSLTREAARTVSTSIRFSKTKIPINSADKAFLKQLASISQVLMNSGTQREARINSIERLTTAYNKFEGGSDTTSANIFRRVAARVPSYFARKGIAVGIDSMVTDLDDGSLALVPICSFWSVRSQREENVIVNDRNLKIPVLTAEPLVIDGEAAGGALGGVSLGKHIFGNLIMNPKLLAKVRDEYVEEIKLGRSAVLPTLKKLGLTRHQLEEGGIFVYVPATLTMSEALAIGNILFYATKKMGSFQDFYQTVLTHAAAHYYSRIEEDGADIVGTGSGWQGVDGALAETFSTLAEICDGPSYNTALKRMLSYASHPKKASDACYDNNATGSMLAMRLITKKLAPGIEEQLGTQVTDAQIIANLPLIDPAVVALAARIARSEFFELPPAEKSSSAHALLRDFE